MKIKVESPGSATVINAIATGCGSAFGIGLHVTAEVKLTGSGIICQAAGVEDTSLMEICVSKVLNKFGIDSGVWVKTESTLPVASGLSSSSATSNAVVLATLEALQDGGLADTRVLTDMEIIQIGIDASLEAGVTITGALDDASASFFGGLTLTDNLSGKILEKKEMEGQNILIYMPQRNSPTAQSDVGRMKLLAPWVKIAFKEAYKGNLYEALTLNGLLYCAALGFEPQMALEALENGAFAAGLSGTGPSFVALCGEDSIDTIEQVWNSYPGEVIRTETDNLGTRVVR